MTIAPQAAVCRTVRCLVRLSHCLIKLVSVSGGAGYPSYGFLVKNQYHERLVWNPLPMRRKPMLRSGNESKPGIVLWMTENDNEWALPFTHGLNSRMDQQRADALALALGQNGHGCKTHALHSTFPARGEDRAEENVSYNLGVIYSDKRHCV